MISGIYWGSWNISLMDKGGLLHWQKRKGAIWRVLKA
jgi:hypothetical protein